ncbi:hypothetical protein MTO96_040976 [Rhipicephalus appendiculatus]
MQGFEALSSFYRTTVHIGEKDASTFRASGQNLIHDVFSVAGGHLQVMGEVRELVTDQGADTPAVGGARDKLVSSPPDIDGQGFLKQDDVEFIAMAWDVLLLGRPFTEEATGVLLPHAKRLTWLDHLRFVVVCCCPQIG